jgi:hypothetical protein
MPDLSQDALWYADRVLTAAPESSVLPEPGQKSLVRNLITQAWLDGYSSGQKSES